MNLSKTPLGNFSGFGKDLGRNMVYLLGIGYIGGSVSSICMSDSLDRIFPVDLTKPPYTQGTKPGLMNSIKGFPYSKKNLSPDGFIDEYLNWYIDTWIFTFSTIRELYLDSASTLKEWCKNTLGSLFVFYFIPYMLIYFSYYCIPVIAAILSVLGAFICTDKAYIFALSFIFSWFYTLRKCESIDIPCIIKMCIIGFTSIAFSFFHIPWWIIISGAAWIYFLSLFYFAPFFKDTPTIAAILKEIMKHKMSLFLLFMALTIQSSLTYFIPGVTIGICICAAYILYTLW